MGKQLREEVTANMRAPYPGLVNYLGEELKMLAPDTEKEIYGWYSERISIVFQEGRNLESFFDEPSHVQESEGIMQAVKKCGEKLGAILGDEERRKRILKKFGTIQGTPFMAYLSKPRKKQPSRTIPDQSCDPIWLGNDLSIKYDECIAPYLHLTTADELTAQIQIDFIYTTDGVNPTDPGILGKLDLRTMQTEILEKVIPESFK